MIVADHNGRLGQAKGADETPSTKSATTSLSRRPGASQRVGLGAGRAPAGAATGPTAAARTAEAEAALRRAEKRAEAAEAAARESGAGVVALGVLVNYLANTVSSQLGWEIVTNQPFTAQRCRSATEHFILEDLFSSVLSYFKKYHPPGNLNFINLGIFCKLKIA